MLGSHAARRGLGATMIAMWVLLGAGAARANDPIGACCLQGGGCQNVQEVQCVNLDGTFIGEGIACATADCSAQVGAPLLSFFGLIAAAGALGGLGVYRLLLRRRAA